METERSRFAESFSDHINEDTGHRTNPAGDSTSSPNAGRRRLMNAAAIEVNRITTDPQHREQFDEDSINRLAESIKEHGQLQPIRVRWDDDRQSYVVIAGERRLRAIKQAELSHIDCIVVDEPLTDDDVLTQQIIENCQREDLQPIERAKAFRALMDRQGWDGKRLAAEMKISEGTVSNALKLLTLDEDTQARLDAGQLKPTVAIQNTRQARSAKRRARPYTATISAGNRVTVLVKFRKSQVDPAETIAALEHALATLRQDAQRDAA